MFFRDWNVAESGKLKRPLDGIPTQGLLIVVGDNQKEENKEREDDG